MSIDTPELLFNPFDPAFRANPYPFYDILREKAPVYLSPLETIVLSRYDDVAVTLRSNDFSRDIEKNANEPTSPLQTRRRERRADGDVKSILNLDPPDHTRLRRLASQAFTPSAIERLRPRVQQLVDDVLDVAAERGSMELIDELAFPVPFQVISDLLAMPTERATELREWSQHLTASLEPTANDDDMDRADEALRLFIPYLIGIVEDRRKNLGDDLLSALIQAEESGDRMSTDELIAFVLLLYVAGHETTVNLIGNGTLALLRNRDQLELLRDDPGLDAGAVEELLRYDSPVQSSRRIVLEDHRVRDVVIPAGTFVVTSIGSANHDPAAFGPDAESLDLRRANASRHLSFGSGVHHCLGAALARLEAQVALGTLVRRFGDLALATDAPAWNNRIVLRGLDSLPVTF